MKIALEALLKKKKLNREKGHVRKLEFEKKIAYHAHGVLAGHGDGLDEDAHADEAGDVALVQLGRVLVGQTG